MTFNGLLGVTSQKTELFTTTDVIILKPRTLLHAGFSFYFFFDPGDGGNIFLQHIRWRSADCLALYPKRENRS
jgi:hypothetical protein